MARSRGWAVTVSFAVGIIAATGFWFYRADLFGRLAQIQSSPVLATVTEAQAEPGLMKKFPGQAMGPRFQLVADDKQVFLVDLKEGRVWRYFRHAKEDGFAKEDEGFLPLTLYYGGTKHYAASEVEPPVQKLVQDGKNESN